MKNKIQINIMAFACISLWGSGFAFTRYIGEEISPYNLVLVRCIFAMVIFLAIGKRVGIRKPQSCNDLLSFVIMGALGFSLFFIFFNIGLTTLPSSEASIISATTPVLTACGMSLIYKERIGKLGWGLIIIAFIGVAILLFWNDIYHLGQITKPNVGFIWMMLSAVSFGGYNIMNVAMKSKGYSALEIVTWSAMCGAVEMIMFLPGTIYDIVTAETSTRMVAAYLGIFPSSIAYYMWSKAMVLSNKTSEVTNYSFLTPLMATIIALFVNNEIPSAGVYIGGIIIVLSVVIFSASRKGDN